MSNYKLVKNTEGLSENVNSELTNVPTTWKIAEFKKFCTITRGGSPRPIQEYLTSDKIKGTPWIKISDATKVTKYINTTEEYIIKSGETRSRIVNPGDLIVSNSASPGIPRFLNIRACIHDGWLLLRDFDGVQKEFLFFLINLVREKLKSQGNGSIFTNLSIDILANFEALLPPIEQQTAIANILSAQESIVQDIESLITKYEKRFQYLSNELLSGRLRVREVNGNIEFYANTEWKEVEVNDEDVEIPVDWTNTQLKTFGKIKTSSVDKKIKKDEDLVDLLNFMDIYKSSSKIIDSTIKFTQTSIKPHVLADNEIKKGDVFFTPSSETEDDIGLAAVAIADIKNTVYSYHLIRFRPSSPNLNIEFSSKLLNYTNCRKYFTRICDGLTRKTLKVGDFEDLAIVYPESLKEQSNIYNVLKLSEDMISTEKDLLLKEKQKFQFLLDNLLSGKYLVEEA